MQGDVACDGGGACVGHDVFNVEKLITTLREASTGDLFTSTPYA